MFSTDQKHLSLMDDLHFDRAVSACAAGGVIAYPTEAVFGLGCLPDNEQAVSKILRLKQRSVDKGLILVAANTAQLAPFVEFAKVEYNQQQIISSWPGPVTWLIPAKPETPAWLTGQHDTLAVRVSAVELVQKLCQKLGPIVSTSANPSAAEPAKSSQAVFDYFLGEVDYIIPADISNDLRPTEIRNAQNGDVIRSN